MRGRRQCCCLGMQQKCLAEPPASRQAAVMAGPCERSEVHIHNQYCRLCKAARYQSEHHWQKWTMLYLESENKDITLYINCFGGDVRRL